MTQVVIQFEQRSTPYPRYQAGEQALMTEEEAQPFLDSGQAVIVSEVDDEGVQHPLHLDQKRARGQRPRVTKVNDTRNVS